MGYNIRVKVTDTDHDEFMKTMDQAMASRRRWLLVQLIGILLLIACQIAFICFEVLPNDIMLFWPLLIIAWGAVFIVRSIWHGRKMSKYVTTTLIEGIRKMNDIFTQVWRHDLTQPGFYWLDVGVVDSHELRRKMIEIGESFAEFSFLSMARFDQQEETKYHLDGGPPGNILMLGYEPSKVKSRLYLADHACAANDLKVDPKSLVSKAMFGNDDDVKLYVTELPQPIEGHSYILFINNSAVLGVMHKAEIVNPDANERRIVNSIMLAPLKPYWCIGYMKEDRDKFIGTEAISQKAY